jgi:hypothetical protein
VSDDSNLNIDIDNDDIEEILQDEVMGDLCSSFGECATIEELLDEVEAEAERAVRDLGTDAEAIAHNVRNVVKGRLFQAGNHVVMARNCDEAARKFGDEVTEFRRLSTGRVLRKVVRVTWMDVTEGEIEVTKGE